MVILIRDYSNIKMQLYKSKDTIEFGELIGSPIVILEPLIIRH